MPVSSDDFLAHAKNIISQDAPDEIDIRSSASRSYYSAYHACYDVAAQCMQPTEPGGSHITAIRALDLGDASIFGKELNQTVRSLSISLRQARDMRTEADYFLDTEFPLRNAQLNVRMAEKMIEKVAKIEANLALKEA
jgi:uncharacterized protein (UPF0332 family)